MPELANNGAFVAVAAALLLLSIAVAMRRLADEDAVADEDAAAAPAMLPPAGDGDGHGEPAAVADDEGEPASVAVPTESDPTPRAGRPMADASNAEVPSADPAAADPSVTVAPSAPEPAGDGEGAAPHEPAARTAATTATTAAGAERPLAAPSAPSAGVGRSPLGPSEAMLICVGLATVAVSLAAGLWESPTSIALLWLLVGVAVAFAAVARAGLGWRPRTWASALGATVAAPRRPPGSGVAAGPFEPPLVGAAGSPTGTGPGAGGVTTTAPHEPRRTSPPTGPADVRPTESATVDAPATPGPPGFHVGLLAAAVVAEAACLTFFGAGRLRSAAWLLHAAAVTLLLVALWRSAAPTERRRLPGWSPVDLTTVGVLMALALALRLWQVGSVPEGVWFDEAQRGLEALRIVGELGYRPIFAAGILQEPTGLWYLMAPLVVLFGREALALRLPVALAGAAGVGAVFLLAWLLYGRRAAIVAAALMVTLTWHVNFSRIALPAVVSLLFDTLAVGLLVLGLRRGSRLWLGTAGVAAGAGLFFYFTSQLLPPLLAVVVLREWLADRAGFVRRCGRGLVLLGVAFALTAGPLILYAATRPRDFAARANAVTVFRDLEQAGSLDPLWANVRSHLLMFQVHGDNNGRHNWPGRPMLDPLTGGLSVVGVALGLAVGVARPTVLLLAWVPIALLGGILSSIWDAPQAHRSISALVPAVILAALPLALLWSGGERALGRLALARRARVARVAPVLLVGTVVALAGVGNVARYFGPQQADIRTWEAFMGPHAAAGRFMNRLPPGVPAYLEPQWFDHPSVRYLDAGQHDHRSFDPGANLPIADDEAAIAISARPAVAERIAALYPGAARTVTVAPDGTVAGYAFVVAPADVEAVRGVRAEYRRGGESVGRREPGLGLGADLAGRPEPPFDAAWTATLTAPAFGTYRFRLDGPPSLVLAVDGADLLRGAGEVAVRLARGNHAVRLTGRGLGGEPVAVRWAPPGQELQPIPARALGVAPVDVAGLLARVFPGVEPAGEAAHEQVDPVIELRTHVLPLPRPYALEWTGALRAERSGRYRFGLRSLGAATLWIDGAQVAAKPVAEGVAEADLQLTRGWHDLRLRFVDTVDYSHVALLWQPPGREAAVVPSAALRPWPAALVPAARPEDALAP